MKVLVFFSCKPILCCGMSYEVYFAVSGFYSQVSHHSRPNETINCKCTVKEDGGLSLYKASLKKEYLDPCLMYYLVCFLANILHEILSLVFGTGRT